jgi:hypothetical protein
MEFTKYDHATKTMHAHKILLELKPKSRNVETNPLEWFFLFVPNPKTVSPVQCRFLFSL